MESDKLGYAEPVMELAQMLWQLKGASHPRPQGMKNVSQKRD